MACAEPPPVAAQAAQAAPTAHGAACDPGAALSVEVVFSPAPGTVDHVVLRLPPGSMLADALQASGVLQRHGLGDAHDLARVGLRCGVWGRPQPPTQPLRDRDRVELWRGLQVDPKDARRLRQRRQRGG